MTEKLVRVTFDNTKLLTPLFGERDKHLSHIEKSLHVSTSSRGNMLSISGTTENVSHATQVIQKLYKNLENGMDVDLNEVDAAIRMASLHSEGHNSAQDAPRLVTKKKHIMPTSRNQADYIHILKAKELVFATGPAGTGKTYLAVAAAVSMLLSHQVERIILSRPAVEAGEKLGFLPGDLKEKIDPYLRPLYDALHDMMPVEMVGRYMETGEIEIAPLAFMRGRTLNNAYVILDEAQNTTPTQMKMFLTRLGQGSRIAVTGDLSQVDLPREIKSGLQDALEKLRPISEIGFVNFTDTDIIRHPLTVKIVQAYNKYEDMEKMKKVLSRHKDAESV